MRSLSEMGFNIKNNYGPNIEVKDGGKLTLVQGKDGLWHTADVEEADFEEVVEDAEDVSVDIDNGKGFVPDKKALEKCFKFNNDFVKRSVGTLRYAKTRSHFRYNSKGDLIETRFPVWTKKGQEYIKKIIQGDKYKEKEINKKKQ